MTESSSDDSTLNRATDLGVRRPLELLLSEIDQLLSSGTFSAQARAQLRVARRRARRLGRLLDVVLDLSRFDGRALALHAVPTNLAMTTKRLCDLFRPAFEQAGVAFTVHCAALPHPVHVDRVMWEKIVCSLLAHALERKDTGELQLTQECVGEDVVLSLADLRSGAYESARARDDESLAREGQESDEAAVASGLALVGELAKLHEGALRIDRSASGATFTVCIPYRPHTEATELVDGALEASPPALDVLDAVRKWQRERAAREAAERESSLKDDVIAVISHELRTPLSAILGWLRALRDGRFSTASVAKVLDVIERNANAQVRLLRDLFDASRIAAGKLELESERVASLSEVVETAIESLVPAAEQSKVRLVCELADATGPVDVDVQRVQQVVWNLLSNALKFTPAAGEVRISCATEGGRVLLRVADMGCGIAPEFLPHVFERFAQERPSRRRPGLGLGLAIARYIVESHGGSIAAQSEGEGRGTTMTVALPLAASGATDLGATRDGERSEHASPLLSEDHTQ